MRFSTVRLVLTVGAALSHPAYAQDSMPLSQRTGTQVSPPVSTIEGVVVGQLDWPVPSMVSGIIVDDGRARYNVGIASPARAVHRPMLVGTADVGEISRVGTVVRVHVLSLTRTAPRMYELSTSRIELRSATPRLTLADPVSTRGMGPVEIGMTVLQLARAVGQPMERRTVPSECGRFDRDCHVREGRCYTFVPSAAPGVSFLIVDDRVAVVNITSRDVKTERGLGVGDTESRIRQLYSQSQILVTRNRHNDNAYSLLVTPSGANAPTIGVVFEMSNGVVDWYRVGARPSVTLEEPCL
jgi:hypothetical protein